MTDAELLERFADYQVLRDISAKTIQRRLMVLNKLGELAAPHGLLQAGRRECRQLLGGYTSPDTRVTYRNSMKAFFVWAVGSGFTTENPAAGLSVTDEPPPTPRPAAPEVAPGDLAVIAAHLEGLKARNYSPATLRARQGALQAFSSATRPGGLLSATEDDVLDFMNGVRAAWSRSSRRSNLRMFYAWAVHRKLITDNPTEGIDGVRLPRRLPRPVTPVELGAAVAAASSGQVQLILLLGALAGLRRSEMAKLHTDDLHLDVEYPFLTVRDGKGGKDRTVPLHPELVPRLRRLPSGWVFPSQVGGHVTPNYLAILARKAFDRVGSTATLHQLRHYFGTAAAEAARGNVLLVSALMGHADPMTTMGYVRFNPGEDATNVVRQIASHTQPDEVTRRRQQRAGGE